MSDELQRALLDVAATFNQAESRLVEARIDTIVDDYGRYPTYAFVLVLPQLPGWESRILTARHDESAPGQIAIQRLAGETHVDETIEVVSLEQYARDLLESDEVQREIGELAG
jgi:hypothetical protein